MAQIDTAIETTEDLAKQYTKTIRAIRIINSTQKDPEITQFLEALKPLNKIEELTNNTNKHYKSNTQLKNLVNKHTETIHQILGIIMEKIEETTQEGEDYALI